MANLFLKYLSRYDVARYDLEQAVNEIKDVSLLKHMIGDHNSAVKGLNSFFAEQEFVTVSIDNVYSLFNTIKYKYETHKIKNYVHPVTSIRPTSNFSVCPMYGVILFVTRRVLKKSTQFTIFMLDSGKKSYLNITKYLESFNRKIYLTLLNDSEVVYSLLRMSRSSIYDEEEILYSVINNIKLDLELIDFRRCNDPKTNNRLLVSSDRIYKDVTTSYISNFKFVLEKCQKYHYTEVVIKLPGSKRITVSKVSHLMFNIIEGELTRTYITEGKEAKLYNPNPDYVSIVNNDVLKFLASNKRQDDYIIINDRLVRRKDFDEYFMSCHYDDTKDILTNLNTIDIFASIDFKPSELKLNRDGMIAYEGEDVPKQLYVRLFNKLFMTIQLNE